LSKEKDNGVDGYSLALAFISIGFISIYFEPFNSIWHINTSIVIGGSLIFIGLTGLVIEISKILKKDKEDVKVLSNLGPAFFLIGVIYVTWVLMKYLDWINNFTLTLLMFLALLVSYGFFRGLALLFKYVFSNSRNKMEIYEVLLRVIPILVSIIALFFK